MLPFVCPSAVMCRVSTQQNSVNESDWLSLGHSKWQYKDFSAGGLTRPTARAKNMDLGSMHERMEFQDPPSSRSSAGQGVWPRCSSSRGCSGACGPSGGTGCSGAGGGTPARLWGLRTPPIGGLQLPNHVFGKRRSRISYFRSDIWQMQPGIQPNMQKQLADETVLKIRMVVVINTAT